VPRGGAAGMDPAEGGGGVLDLASAVEAEALYPGSVELLADLRPGRPAAELTPAQLGARLSRLVLRAAPGSALRRTEAADLRRGCSLRVLPDGMALLSVTGRTELLGAAFARLDATARALLAAESKGGPLGTAGTAGNADRAPDSTVEPPPAPRDASRTLDQTRVDVLLATILGHSSDLAQANGVQISLALVAPAGTVLAGGDAPGELVGLGPVPAPLVRALAADAAWQRWDHRPPHRPGRRRRPTPVPAQRSRRRPRASQRHRLPLPHLPPPGRRLRPGPRRPLPRRAHRAREPGRPVPHPPPRQAPRRVPATHRSRRHHHLDHPDRPSAHRPSPLLGGPRTTGAGQALDAPTVPRTTPATTHPRSS
jgi:hypothetical protein